jgi:hypothetical protein
MKPLKGIEKVELPVGELLVKLPGKITLVYAKFRKSPFHTGFPGTPAERTAVSEGSPPDTFGYAPEGSAAILPWTSVPRSVPAPLIRNWRQRYKVWLPGSL